MAAPLKVLVILGSVRTGRMSERVASFVMQRLATVEGVSAELADLGAIDLPIMEERLGRVDPPPPGLVELGASIRNADAIVWCQAVTSPVAGLRVVRGEVTAAV